MIAILSGAAERTSRTTFTHLRTMSYSRLRNASAIGPIKHGTILFM